MIVAFDLDDTLYRELDYVESGFRAVAEHVSARYPIDAKSALAILDDSLEQHGRGRQFDDVLRSLGMFSTARRHELIQVYRRHRPELALPEASAVALARAGDTGHRRFLVTDGNSNVQASKVTALGLWSVFEHAYLTSRYGRDATKPSTKTFELMLRRTGDRPEDLVYIGDNPSKDFVGLRSLGARTVRVHTGPYADVTARPGFDADAHAATITDAVETALELLG